MIASLLLLDVAPEPVSGPIIGIAGLILIVIIVLMIAAGAITGLVLLLMWRKRRTPESIPGAEVTSQPAPQFQPSNPNQS